MSEYCCRRVSGRTAAEGEGEEGEVEGEEDEDEDEEDDANSSATRHRTTVAQRRRAQTARAVRGQNKWLSWVLAIENAAGTKSRARRQ